MRPEEKVRVVNLTPHSVQVYDGDESVAAWPPSGRFARVVELTRPEQDLSTDQGAVPVIGVRYGTDVVDLPLEQPGTVYVVSRVLAAAVDRADLYFPADEVRDDAGGIIGCRSLGRFVRRDPDNA